MIYILCNSVGWKVLWPTQHAAEEGSICGCSGDRPDRCRVTPGCLYIKTIGSPDLYFYNVPVCHSVEIIGKSTCLLTISHHPKFHSQAFKLKLNLWFHKNLEIWQNCCVTYWGSDTMDPDTLSNPRLCAAIAAAAIVFTLLGARGHNSRTGPSTKKYISHKIKLW